MLSVAANRDPEIAKEPESQLAELASLCKASADPLRLQVLRVLLGGSFGVMELCAIFDIRQPALSHHLKVLASARLVATRREGNSIFYRRIELGQDKYLGALKCQIFAEVDQIELSHEINCRIDALYRQREENSRSFFAQNAHKFHQQQDLIASYGQYAETVAQVLQDAPLQQYRKALEVGSGDGSFLAELSPRFKQIIALDNSAEMLSQARSQAVSGSLDNIEFVHGDTTAADLQDLQADCIVINMVLHHTPKPAQIFSDVAALLAPGGVLLVTDLCSHDQSWARENCGDLWLGFEPTDLEKWARDAGLDNIASTYLAQRNGFQIQVRLFGHSQQLIDSLKR
jgi:ubiquinone/menaquinone biosynthesis C-methylase UbiE/DNA-binding transcriptional ArsR family regulator